MYTYIRQIKVNHSEISHIRKIYALQNKEMFISVSCTWVIHRCRLTRISGDVTWCGRWTQTLSTISVLNQASSVVNNISALYVARTYKRTSIRRFSGCTKFSLYPLISLAQSPTNCETPFGDTLERCSEPHSRGKPSQSLRIIEQCTGALETPDHEIVLIIR